MSKVEHDLRQYEAKEDREQARDMSYEAQHDELCKLAEKELADCGYCEELDLGLDEVVIASVKREGNWVRGYLLALMRENPLFRNMVIRSRDDVITSYVDHHLADKFRRGDL